MNQQIKQKWIDALKSGKYVQSQKVLKTNTNEFCCLGVLCDLYDKEQNTISWKETENGYSYFQDETVSNMKIACSLPPKIQAWSGINDEVGYFNNPNENSLSNLNDRGKTFDEIADIIEKHF